MSILEFFALLIIAGICGGVAQSIVGYSHQGCLASIFLGFVGALLGTWMARQMGLPEMLVVQLGDQSYPVIWSIIGACIFVALLALISGRRRRVDE